MSPDCELVSAYVKDGEENAFRSLVARHVDLVYGTALRQVGDRGIAEEITQNVFMALARKAPRFGRSGTLAGWLHRSTVLEAKARIRSELRRRRREDVAAERIVIEQDGTSMYDACVPLVDEALMTLRDSDRLALVLRFFENRSLREVGIALGVEEDAARKRVSRALERISEFFRNRGFAAVAVAGTGVGTEALLARAAHGAPAGLAASSSKAALTATAAGSAGLKWILLQWITPSPVQVALICAVSAAVPLLIQQQAGATLATRHQELKRAVTREESRRNDLEDELGRLRQSISDLNARTLDNESQRNLWASRLEGRSPVPAYEWDDSMPLARVPKALLAQLEIPAMENKRGTLTEQIREVLQMTGAEASGVQAATTRFVRGFEDLAAGSVRKAEPTADDRRWRPGEEVRVFEMPDITEEFKHLRAAYFTDLSSLLGDERAGFFQRKLHYWMPITDEFAGLNSGLAIIPFAHRVRFHPGSYGFPALGWGMSKLNGEGMSGTMDVDDIPWYLRPQLQDWIDAARENAGVQ